MSGLTRVAACVGALSWILLARPAAANDASQATRLVELLELKPGMTVADIGAGRGDMTVLMARRVGQGSRIYSTDINDERLAEIRAAISRERLDNVAVVKGAGLATNLPEASCDAIFIRDVYHHFPDPGSMNRSLFASLKAGGRLAIIDFVPDPGSELPKGAPATRGGHGVRPEQVIEEVTAAGFARATTIDDWDDGMFLVLFRKRKPSVGAEPHNNQMQRTRPAQASEPRR